MGVRVEDLNFSYNSERVLKGIDMSGREGKITAVIGPNAAGKSTLLKCIGGLLSPNHGNILLNGRKASGYEKEELSKQVSYLPQEISTRAVLSVFEAVLLGKVHSLSWWGISEDHKEGVWRTLERLRISDLASDHLNELSGGQKQIVAIGQSLIKGPRVLLLDELTSNLDLQHQLEILDVTREITREENIATLITTHDINQAARYADKMVVLNGGSIYTAGDPDSVLTPSMVKTVYGVNARINIEDGETPHVIPINSARRESRK